MTIVQYVSSLTSATVLQLGFLLYLAPNSRLFRAVWNVDAAEMYLFVLNDMLKLLMQRR